ncbi:capsid cement protein [Rhodococcus sp. 114MFTsu3.1]|uniref:capsid cement protein n=1 Tax=Rhodococcus sp. 114MFTsu3.1 TaxID=1172184 RepID=UPI00036892D9|nr:capsid cement protein [Rhodococcus sp. 114MFTsu3.1]
MPTQNRVYEPGRNITGRATAAVTNRRFVAISGNRHASGNVSIAPAAAGARVFGVAADDAAIGDLVNVLRDGVVRVDAGAVIAAGAAVEVGAAGKAVTAASGTVVGFALTGAANNTVAEIALV